MWGDRMLDRASLGTKYSCYKCGTKFYDLQRKAAICPECGIDQVDAPNQNKKVSLTGKEDAAAGQTDANVLLAFDSDDETPSVVEENDQFMPESDD